MKPASAPLIMLHQPDLAQCLHQQALDVPGTTTLAELSALAGAMREVFNGSDPDRYLNPFPAPVSPVGGGAGGVVGSRVFSLSAPQVGLGPHLTVSPYQDYPNGKPWRLFIVDLDRLDKAGHSFGSGLLVVINPEVVAIDNNTWNNVQWEECLSTPPPKANPDHLLVAEVQRSASITLEYDDLTTWGSSTRQSATFTGVLGHLVQHELDHLNGKLCYSMWNPVALQAKCQDIYDASQAPLRWPDVGYKSFFYP